MGFGRTAKSVSDMELDEVSLVDRPANPHASIVIAKSAQGADMEETGYYRMDGSPITVEDEIGADEQFQDADGTVYTLNLDEIEDAANAGADEDADERELATVGKSSAFGRTSRGSVQKSLAEELREELAKSVGDAGTRETLAKALQAVEASAREADEAKSIAKSERDIRLTREYIGKAASYGEIPGVTPEVLGPILKRCEEFLPEADCVVLNKVFESTGGVLFKELGLTGGGTETGDDPMAVAEAAIAAGVSKGGEEISKEARQVAYFSEHPEEYDRYVGTLGAR